MTVIFFHCVLVGDIWAAIQVAYMSCVTHM